MSSVIFHKQDLTKLTPVSSKFQRLNHADFLKENTPNTRPTNRLLKQQPNYLNLLKDINLFSIMLIATPFIPETCRCRLFYRLTVTETGRFKIQL